jgi:hypothetical protein
LCPITILQEPATNPANCDVRITFALPEIVLLLVYPITMLLDPEIEEILPIPMLEDPAIEETTPMYTFVDTVA